MKLLVYLVNIRGYLANLSVYLVNICWYLVNLYVYLMNTREYLLKSHAYLLNINRYPANIRRSPLSVQLLWCKYTMVIICSFPFITYPCSEDNVQSKPSTKNFFITLNHRELGTIKGYGSWSFPAPNALLYAIITTPNLGDEYTGYRYLHQNIPEA